MSPATGGGGGRCKEKPKANIKNEKKNKTEDAKNHLNPGYNFGNASCATNEWPDYPDRPDPTLSGGVGRTNTQINHPQPSPRKNKQLRNKPSRKKPNPKTWKTSSSRKTTPQSPGKRLAKKYRVQPRSESQLSTAAPRYSVP